MLGCRAHRVADTGYPPQPVIWQGAAPHGARHVGNGTQTFALVGCVVTSVAMALRFLGVRAGASPLQVHAAGLLRPGVWAPGASGCVVPELVRAQTDLEVGTDMDGAGRVASVERLRPLLVDAIRAGGVAMVAVDYDAHSPTGDATAEHWCCAFGLDGADLLIADPATSKVERLPLVTLSAGVRWGRRERRYTVVRAVTVFRG